MRYLIICTLMLAMVACGQDGCENAGGGTVARKPTAYRGDPSANLPYIETGKIHKQRADWFGLRPTIHNPVNQDIKVKISCQYWLDSAKATKANPTKNVTVRKRSSRVFEGFDWLVNNWSGQTLNVAARCTAIFDGYPVKHSDAVPAQ